MGCPWHAAFPPTAGGRGAAGLKRRGTSALAEAKSPLLPVPWGLAGGAFGLPRVSGPGRRRPRGCLGRPTSARTALPPICFGPFDRRAQAKGRSARRSATPPLAAASDPFAAGQVQGYDTLFAAQRLSPSAL